MFYVTIFRVKYNISWEHVLFRDFFVVILFQYFLYFGSVVNPSATAGERQAMAVVLSAWADGTVSLVGKVRTMLFEQ